jgi:hypothetical protein
MIITSDVNIGVGIMEPKQIWKQNENNINTWMCLVKNINLDNRPKKAAAKIAVDSKYWLWINSKLAVFEGGVKRGPSKNGTYYDTVDITPYLEGGENRIAILVWFFGDDGFSHLSSKMGGLIFDADIDGQHIVSDESWKIMKHPAYVSPDKDDIPSNFRLAESNVYFDASLDIGNWYNNSYDVSKWDNADVITDSTWGKLCHRIIPMFKDYGLKDYRNSSDYEGFVTNSETVIEMKLEYNAQITPYLKIKSPAGKRISIKSDTYDDNEYNTKSVMAVYYTKDGEQEYESYGWINGESIYYTLPAGVTICSLKYRETGYNTEFAGDFKCDDKFLNKLWEKSLRTLYITMRDNFMDCPDRERAQWWGDVNVEMQMMMYCLDKNALLLYKKGADLLAGWYEDCSYMLTVAPSGKDQFELPFQNLACIWGFSYFYEYTGDIDLIKRVYPMSKSYVLGYSLTNDGVVEHKKGSWDWLDWGENADCAPMENAWYYMALSSCVKMAGLAGIDDDIPLYKERMEKIKDNYNKLFFKDGFYYNSTANNKPDDRANALSVLSGFADSDKYKSVSGILKSTENSSPYMEKYVLDALCEMGLIDDAVIRMKHRYKEMVEYDYSTLWEYWTTEGTKNHAWSGGPLITMSKYIAGIRPTDIAYSRFEIKPYMGKLNFIKCTVPSIKGKIILDIKKSGSHITMNVTIPNDTVAEVYLPLPDNTRPINPILPFILVNGYAKFTITTAGEYSFNA